MTNNGLHQRNNLLIAGAVLSVLFLLFIYPTRQPDYAARYFNEASVNTEMGLNFFESIGNPINELSSEIVLQKSAELVTLFQNEVGRGSIKKWIDEETLQQWPVFYWKTIYGNTQPISFSLDFSSEDPITVNEETTGDFLLFQLKNGTVFQYERNIQEDTDQQTPFKERLSILFPDWKSIYTFIPDSLKISADVDKDSTRIEQLSQGNVAIFLGKDFYLHLADKYLSSTLWGTLSQDVAPVVTTGSEHPVTVEFSYTPEPFNHSIRLHVDMSVNGTLLNIKPNWEIRSSSSYTGPIIGIGYGMFGIIMFAVFIIFLRRYYARLLDFRSCYPDAVFGFFIIFFAIIADALVNYIFGTLDFSAFLMMIFFGAIIAGFVVAGLFLLMGATGFSVGHEASKKHLISLNFARRGYWFNKPVGRGLYFGSLIAVIAAGSVGLVAWLAFNIPVSFKTGTMNSGIIPFMDDFTTAINNLILVYATIFGVVLTVAMAIYNRFQHWKFVIIFLIIFFTFWNFSAVVLQTWYMTLIINLILALIWVYTFKKFDAFTLFVAIFMFIFWYKMMNGFIPFGWTSYHFIVMMPMIVVILLLGYTAMKRGLDLYDIPEYVPAYIIEHSRRERIERELEIARQVQQNFLPETAPNVHGLDIAARCTPAFEIGGDYFDFIKIDEKYTAVLIGDVSGKGIQAAFYMTLVKGFIRSLCRDTIQPDELILKVNALFRENVPKGTFITMIYGIYNSESSEFTFVRAGHDPLLIVSDRKIKLCQPKGFPLGMVDNNQFKPNIEVQTVTLNPGDAAVLFTDGYTETRNRRGEFFGEDRLEQMLSGLPLLNAHDILDRLTAGINQFRQDQPQHDDITTIVLFRK